MTKKKKNHQHASDVKSLDMLDAVETQCSYHCSKTMKNMQTFKINIIILHINNYI